MRSLLCLAACSLLAILPACSEKKAAISNSPAPVGTAPVEEETPVEEEPPPTDPLVIDLGEVTTGKDVTFDVPEGALGFNITAEGTAADFDPNQPYGIARIVAPDGTIVHDSFTPKGGTSPTSYAAFDTIASVSVPQGEDVPKDLTGTWKVRFGVYGSSSVKPKLNARVRIQSSGDGSFHGGQLDLHIHVPEGLQIGDHIVDAAKAASDPELEERVETFFALTSTLLGIEKGKVVFSKEARSYQELDGVEELLKGFAISTGEKDGAQVLHILLTNLIADNGEPFAAGIAPGIPGAATIFGRSVSGIIVTTSPSPEQDVLTMLHEAGHFFGLNHTTEFSGESSDPLSDTPACADISQSNFMDCPDRANIMFAAGAIEGPPTLSASQKRVYRGSPIYRALTAETSSTMSLTTRAAPFSVQRAFRLSGKTTLSPIERELSLGFCGLTKVDAGGLVKRHGRAQTISELRVAAADADLAPYIRGRANLALKALGEK